MQCELNYHEVIIINAHILHKNTKQNMTIKCSQIPGVVF